VVFHGFLSKGEPTQREQFFKLLQDCTLFTMPSRYEPYGVAVVEAMVYGMPVIATDRWAFPELVGDNGACVPLDDVDAMADRIGWLLDDPDKRAELGVRARKRAIERFNWDRVARQMIDVAGLD
jgi:glycosyltransferase involved in cell wall biosynthesis